MKRVITIITLLVLLVGSVFATDWVKRGSYNNSVAGDYSVYYDFDAKEPFDYDKNLYSYIEYLEKIYQKVDCVYVSKENAEKSNSWCLEAVKHNCYSTLEVHKDYVIEDHVYSDGNILEIICYKK